MSVLLSHIAEETAVAAVLQEWIETSLDHDVQVSGEVDNVELGKQRLAEVDRALSAAGIVLLLCSERSVGRPWINFESGCAWFKRVPVIAVCHDGCFPADLPPPLGSFPAYDLTDAASCQALMETLAKYLKRKRVPRIDCDLMVAELRAALDPSQAPAQPARRSKVAPEAPAQRSKVVPDPLAKRSKVVPDPLAKRPPAVQKPPAEPPPDVPAPAPAARASAPPPQPLEIRLLAAISRAPDFTCTAPSLAMALDEREGEVRHCLEKLANNHMLALKASTHPTDPDTRYALADRGRMYLQKYAA